MSTAPFLAPHRADESRTGRAKASGGTVYYWLPGSGEESLGTQTFTDARTYYTPFMLRAPILVDQFACEVTISQTSANVRIGLYASSRDWQPTGAPRADSGSVATATTGVKTYSPAAPLYLPPGRYLTAVRFDVANVQLRVARGVGDVGQAYLTTLGSNSANLFYVNEAYGAYATTGTAWTDNIASNAYGMFHPVFLRLL